MRGVPENLKLASFIGATLIKADPLENVFYFTFERPRGRRRRLKGAELQIGVEGEWELRNGLESLVAGGRPIPKTTLDLPLYPIGAKVVGSEVRAPRSFVLKFETGDRLEVFDSSSQYESFSIPQEGVWI